MHKLRPWLSSIFISAAASVAAVASAAGLGAGGSAAVLGQPLDFSVQVRLDAGDTSALECIVAEVMLGERRLPASLVRATVESRGPDMARIRIVTMQPVDEPVIDINLGAGCVSRITRRYVVLADPPPINLQPPLEAAALPLAESTSSANAPGSVAVLPRTTDTAAPPPTAAPTKPAAPVRGPAAQAGTRTPASAARRAARKAERQQAAQLAATNARRAAAAEPPARLQLEMVAPGGERATVDEAIEAVAQAASATRAAHAAASANAERLASMERTVEQLRNDASASRELAAQMRARLIESDQSYQSGRWMLPLLLMTLMLAALAAWLAWRLAVAQRERQQGWQVAAQPTAAGPGAAPPRRPPDAPSAFLTSEGQPTLPVLQRARAKATSAWPPPARTEVLEGPPTQPLAPPVAAPTAARRTAPRAEAPEPPMQRTEVLPPQMRIDESASRDVSIEELIDLEQQAEFFVVLGQDGSAVELLDEHLRSSGGGSPLPFLKLLEIHHRRGDRKAYESIRARFNHQFNAYAPEWGADLAAGRALADYSGVIPRLQQVWARPLDAMAELEALLFRKSRGDLFELPAYREVLFLYALARDLMDREGAEAGDVDLLLPMADGSEFSSTAPAPYRGLESASEPPAPDEHPTLPLDFDLSVMDRPSSIFDKLDEPITQSPQPR